MPTELPRRAPDWARDVPGTWGHPLWGHTLEFLRDYEGLVERLRQRYGPVFRLRFVSSWDVMAVGVEAHRVLLKDDATSVSNELGWQFSMGTLFEGGLMLRDGEDHRQHRRIMQSAFARRALEGYLEQMGPIVRESVMRLFDRPTVRVYDWAHAMTMNVATRVLMGLPLGPDASRVISLYQRLVKGTLALVRREVPGLTWSRALAARRELQGYFTEIVGARRSAPTDDLLGRLITARSDTGERFTTEEIVDHVIFMVLASHDTTTAGLVGMLCELGKHPTWQERLREEATAHAGALERVGDLDYSTLRTLPLLDDCFREVLRMHTPVPCVPRTTLRPVSIAGVRIAAGTRVSFSPSHTHRDPALWTDPERFDPARFAEPRAEHKRTPFAYLPFGAGAHACLGAVFTEIETKRTVLEVLARYRWRLPSNYRPPYRVVPLPVPRDGLPIHFEPR